MPHLLHGATDWLANTGDWFSRLTGSSDGAFFNFFATSGQEDTLLKLLESWDLPAAKSAISGPVRALGFGPEADGIATFLIGFFILLVIVGYAAGPKNTNQDVSQKTDDKK